MSLNRTKLLMYSAIVPYSLVSLAGAACAPKTIAPAAPTLTERTQETNSPPTVFHELTDLLVSNLQNIGTGYFEFNDNPVLLDKFPGREEYTVKIYEPSLRTEVRINKSKISPSASVRFYHPALETLEIYSDSDTDNLENTFILDSIKT